MYYSYGVQLGELWLREGMLNGGMQECRGYRETKRGGGIQKLSYCSIFKKLHMKSTLYFDF